MILNKIVAYKKRKLEEDKKTTPLDALIRQMGKCEAPRNFKKSIDMENRLSIIAEVKKASPSGGTIKKNFDPLAIAKAFDKDKVEAISVLTEDKFFQGKDQYLSDIRYITSLPILRKDFIIDPYQIYQSRALGADAVLLIAAILSKKQLIRFQAIAKEIGLQCLVEVHDRSELETVLETEAEIVGINNRDLKTFQTTIQTTEKLIQFIPKDRIAISESGIMNRADMKFLEDTGVKGVLIGESLMKAKSIHDKLRELRGETD